jgi:hypothetical protein
MSFSRSAGSPYDDAKSKRHTHFTSQASLLEAVAKEKGPSTRVVFFYTIGLTGDNGQNGDNNTKVKELIAAFQEQGWLSDPNVLIVHTSTYHASAKTAGHQDNLSANYGLTDYGASKVLQTLQFAAAIYALDTKAVQSIPYKRLLEVSCTCPHCSHSKQISLCARSLCALPIHWARLFMYNSFASHRSSSFIG